MARGRERLLILLLIAALLPGVALPSGADPAGEDPPGADTDVQALMRRQADLSAAPEPAPEPEHRLSPEAEQRRREAERGDLDAPTVRSAESSFQQVEPPPPAPVNDDLADAIVIDPASLPISLTATNEGAALELPEVGLEECWGITDTVWYQITPTADMLVQVDTFGSDHDTVLAVRQGASYDELELLGCNDQARDENFNHTDQSKVTLPMMAGQTYSIQAGGWYRQDGDLTVNLSEATPASNDDFADAIALTTLPATIGLPDGALTTELGEDLACASGETVGTRWFSYTAGSEPVDLVVTETPSNFGYGAVNAWLGTSKDDLQLQGCGFPVVRTTVPAGQTLWLQVEDDEEPMILQVALDDGRPALDISGGDGIYDLTENPVSSGQIELFADQPLSSPLPVAYAFDDNSWNATFGEDYTASFNGTPLAASGTLTLPAGDEEWSITVTTVDDDLAEDWEYTFFDVLPNGEAYYPPDHSIYFEIQDDEGVSPGEQRVNVGASYPFTAFEHGPRNDDLWVSLDTPAPAGGTQVEVMLTGTAGPTADYQAGINEAPLTATATYTFPEGSSFERIDIDPLQDALDEGLELIWVTAAIGDQSDSEYIDLVDDDGNGSQTGDPVVAVVGLLGDGIAEDAGTADAFRVTLNQSLADPLEVPYTVTDSGTPEALQGEAVTGSGGSGVQYELAIGDQVLTDSGTITIPAGTTSQTVTITPVDDQVEEPDLDVTIEVGEGEGYELGSPTQASTTIIDDDHPVFVGIDLDPFALAEGYATPATLTGSAPGAELDAQDTTFTLVDPGGTPVPAESWQATVTSADGLTLTLTGQLPVGEYHLTATTHNVTADGWFIVAAPAIFINPSTIEQGSEGWMTVDGFATAFAADDTSVRLLDDTDTEVAGAIGDVEVFGPTAMRVELLGPLPVGTHTVEVTDGEDTVLTAPLTITTPPPCRLDLAIPAGQGITNMGFEADPALDGWTIGAVTDAVITSSGDAHATPWEGDTMAVLGTPADNAGVSQAPGPNRICQDFVVDQPTESFVYNVVTYDYVGFDEFSYEVWTVDDDGTPEDRIAVGRQGAFGSGIDRKTTGWVGVELDLSDHVGDTLRIIFSAGGTHDTLFPFWVYLDAVGDAPPVSTAPPAPPTSDTGSTWIDPATGQSTVSMPFGAPSAVTYTVTMACPEGQVISNAHLLFAGVAYPATNTTGDTWTATIPAEAISANGGGTVSKSFDCDGAQQVGDVGTIVLYDPSGVITDATTGDPVVGATVTLHVVPGWTAKTGPDDDAPDTCQSNLSKDPADEPWNQPAPSGLGQKVPAASVAISPNVNPQTTNAVGYYGWDVAAGCYYLTVTAEGYQPLTSPVVGVPPEVTDLHLQLTPTPTGGGNTGGGGGGVTPAEEPTEEPTEGPGPMFAVVTPADDPSGNSEVSVALSQLAHPDPTRAFAQDDGPVEVLLASETVFADALSSGALQDDRVLLLTDPTRLEAHVLDELDRLGADSVRILGGEAAVAPEVAVTLDAQGFTVARTAGATRLETAVAIADLVGGDRAFLARAFPAAGALDPTQAFADSLALGGWAAATGRSVLLTQSEVLSGTTAGHLQQAGIAGLDVIGGTAAISQAARDAAADAVGDVDRVAGQSRFGTAVAIAEARGFDASSPAESIVLVEGQAANAWAAGFSAAHLAALTDSPVLLLNGDRLPQSTEAFLASAVSDDADVVCAGTQAACDLVADLLGR